MKKLKIEDVKDIDDLYYDQSRHDSTYGDRRITSAWTPYGLRTIDGEFGRRIRNIMDPVTRLIKVKRTPHYTSAMNGYSVPYHSDYWDEYTELPLDQDFHSFDRCVFIHDDNDPYYKIRWDAKTQAEHARKIVLGRPVQTHQVCATIYTYTHPTYSAKHRGEDPKALRKEIKECINLHYLIRENLLSNLDSYLRLK